MKIAAGSIVGTVGTDFVSRAILRFQQSRGEATSMISHVGMVAYDAPLRECKIVEATATGVKLNPLSVHAKNKIVIFSPVGLSHADRTTVLYKAHSYLGRKYGYLKIGAHAIDWLLGGRYFARRLARMDRYPICSWVVAYAYHAVGRNFKVLPGECQPDDIWDYCMAFPGKWRVTVPLGKVWFP